LTVWLGCRERAFPSRRMSWGHVPKGTMGTLNLDPPMIMCCVVCGGPVAWAGATRRVVSGAARPKPAKRALSRAGPGGWPEMSATSSVVPGPSTSRRCPSGHQPCPEGALQDTSHVPKVPFRTFNVRMVPFGTSDMSRRCPSGRRHPLGGAGRCAPGAREADPTNGAPHSRTSSSVGPGLVL